MVRVGDVLDYGFEYGFLRGFYCRDCEEWFYTMEGPRPRFCPVCRGQRLACSAEVDMDKLNGGKSNG